MRRTTLHRTTVTATAAAALLLALAGCGGTQNDGKGSAGSVSPAGSGAPSPSPTAPTDPAASTPAQPSPKPPSGCAHQSELTAADTGRTVCLSVGGYLRLNLDGTKDRPWSPVRATGAVLKGADAGIVILPGDALAAYTAVAPGTARLTSSRPLCATGPGKVSCKAVQDWTVTVRVTKP
ncbi:hypothetical protein ACF061_32710 [Streptomyces sp. NPDC015220]|uniref:hypothetical protein n=1 Tax=Streptomyces sp. NPDC015220 TaxID=3364947 RepID=UPI0037035954